MTALAADRATSERRNKQFSFPVKGSTKIYAGALVCINSSGLAKLIETIDALSTGGMEVWLADLTALHRQTFEAAGVTSLVDCFTTTKEARKQLTTGA